MSQIIEAILRSGSKGTTGAADVTSSSIDSNTQALDVTLKGSPSVSVSNFPGSQAVTGPLTDNQLRASAVPVSGTFFQGTQPISGSVSVSNFPASQAVTGAFFQGTQPVSGSVSVSNFPASQAVTGTFFQGTQPVSIASMPSTPVTGTFFQGTQPVSGTVTATGPLTDTQIRATPLPVSGTVTATGPLTDTQLRATPVPISGTVTASGPLTDTQLRASAVPVSGPLTDTQIRATALPVSGTVSANASQAGTWTVQPGNTANTTAWKVDGSAVTQPVSGTVTSNQGGTWTVQPGNTANTTAWKVDGSAVTQPVSGTVTANTGTLPTLTKGTQGSTGFSTQDLKDSGRNQTNYYMAIQIVSTNADALLSLTGYKSGALVNATTTPAVVTSGKTYLINSITLTYVTIVTTPGAIRFTLRANLSGVVAIGSPVVMNWTVGEPTGIAPVAGKFNTVTIPFPDGLEFAAGTGIGISQVGLNTVGTAAAVGYGIVTITGFEY